MCHELFLRRIEFKRQIPIPVEYKGVHLDCGYRADLIVQDEAVLELKSVEHILKVHEAQLMTYMKLLKLKKGLLINFHVSALRHGIVRRVL